VAEICPDTDWPDVLIDLPFHLCLLREQIRTLIHSGQKTLRSGPGPYRKRKTAGL